MNIVNDNKIKNIVLKNNTYEIQTKSDDILRKYDASIKTATEPKKKKFIPLFASISSALLITGSALIVAFVLAKPRNSDIFSPYKNKNIQQELLTFNAFSQSNISKNIINKNKAIQSESTFNEIVDHYEVVQSGIKQLFNLDEYKIINVESDFVYEDITYKYETRILDKSNIIYARVYYNEIADENTKNLEALYVFDKSYYSALISCENSNDESEIKTILTPINDLEKKIYVIEKEKEYKGANSENSYSYSIYSSLEDYKNDDDNYLNKIEYEIDNNDISVSISSNVNNFEIEFDNISKINDDHFNFSLDEYETNNEEIDEALFDLFYLADNSRRYVSGNYQIIKK